VYGIVTPGSPSKLTDSTPAQSGPTRVPGGTWNQRIWGTVERSDGSK
jgi:hypothetical protein